MELRRTLWRENPVFRNLPPQEGLFEPTKEDESSKKIEKEAQRLAHNSDFRILDLDEEIAAAKSQEVTDLEKEDEAYERMEHILKEKHGDIYSSKANYQFLEDRGLMDSNETRTHKGAKKDKEAKESLKPKLEADEDDGFRNIFEEIMQGRKEAKARRSNAAAADYDDDEDDDVDDLEYARLRKKFIRSVIMRSEDKSDKQRNTEREGKRCNNLLEEVALEKEDTKGYGKRERHEKEAKQIKNTGKSSKRILEHMKWKK